MQNKLKKAVAVVFALITVFAFASCGNDESTKIKSETTEREQTAKADLDLSKLSGTVVYSEVYNMLSKPDDYMGKLIKIKGNFSVYSEKDENGNPIPEKTFFACVIPDATACCSQGMEFVLSGDYVYPADYPEIGTEITVQGEFSTYMDGGQKYCTLKDAVMYY